MPHSQEKPLPDHRRQRGPHQKDEACFTGDALATLQAAVADLSWLLSRGYSNRAALELVGNRYALRDRQRKALRHCAASDDACRQRRRRQVTLDSLHDRRLLIDGYNILLTVEAALSGGVLLLGRDGVLRDMAAMSRHYRRVQTTLPALELIADCCSSHGCVELEWYFDRPISNSGRLKKLIEGLATSRGWPWQIRLVADPDRTLKAADDTVATSDSAILDRCDSWVNLARHVVERSVAGAWVLDLRSGPEGSAPP